jgi:hypothetical protein
MKSRKWTGPESAGPELLKLQSRGLCIHGFFLAKSNALVPNAFQLFRLGRQGAETETGFFGEFSQFPSNPPAEALFSGKPL